MHPKVLAHILGQGAKGQGPRWATLVALCGANLPPFGKGGHTWLLGTTNGNYKPMARHAHATCAFGKLHTTPAARAFWLHF